jgi:hypothetical protein
MTDDTGEFDLYKGRARRDRGMLLVAGNNKDFGYQFLHTVIALPKGWVGQCEDIRKDWPGTRPRHPNAWGACWNGAVKRGLLKRLPQMVAMTGVRSHGRKTHLHERI